MRRRIPWCVIMLALAGLTSCGGGPSSSTAPSGTPRVSLSATSLTFDGQVVGSTSPAQLVLLTNSGSAPLSISGVTASGDFAVSQNCGSFLGASLSCTLSVSFAPLSGGPQTGSLTITSNASGSPQSVALTGTGMDGLVKLSTDTFTNTDSQHATEVEPDTFAYDMTIVTVFQVGRFNTGGASAIGFATSLDGGTTWTNGFLPGITKFQDATNPYDRVSDPAIAYDAFHGVWLAASLPIAASGAVVTAPNIIVNRSTDDGLTWSGPITVTTTGDYDKNWIACDNWPLSPHYGNCYVEWDVPALSDQIRMSTSRDGGVNWEPALAPASGGRGIHGIGGQPVVQPDGTIVVPIADAFENSILAFTSTDGGASWSATALVSLVSDHHVAGNLRTGPLPSADVDAAGNVYVVWQDCSFRTNCTSNDIVMSTSSDGVAWSSPIPIPIDDLSSTVDHFIPGLAVDPTTSGSTAHLALTYYYYPDYNCIATTCELNVGFVSSDDGGATWTAPVQLAGPMKLASLPATTQGVMVGDYISTSYVNGLAFGAFAVANPASGTVFDQAIYTTVNGLLVDRNLPRFSSAGQRPHPNARSDRLVRTTPLKIR